MSLTLRHVSVERAGRLLIENLSPELEPGTCSALIGANGSGKSSLLLALAGSPELVTTGEIIWKGEQINERSLEERALSGIFLLFQQSVEIPGLGMRAFLHTALNRQREHKGEKRLDPRVFQESLREAAARVGISTELLDRSLHVGFSGGEKKRSEMLQMELLEPDVLLLDEPDSGLDAAGIDVLCDLIDRAKQRGAIVFIVSHYPQLIERLKPSKTWRLEESHLVLV